MVFHGSRLVFHGSRPVFMVFHGSKLVLMVFHGSRLVVHVFSCLDFEMMVTFKMMGLLTVRRVKELN